MKLAVPDAGYAMLSDRVLEFKRLLVSEEPLVAELAVVAAFLRVGEEEEDMDQGNNCAKAERGEFLRAEEEEEDGCCRRRRRLGKAGNLAPAD